MKLLIFTQRVDVDDPTLSFFHRWIIEFARHFESILVICLYEGRHELPANVKVFSLGKETKPSRFTYLFRFYKYIWAFRQRYGSVFIHQNQEYALLGGLFWKLARKKVVMWRNHYAGSLLTDVAAAFCTNVMCTSTYSYTAKYAKTIFMPVGVDTDRFRPEPGLARIPRSILCLGRIAPSKKIHVLIEALGSLRRTGVDFSASIYGSVRPEEAEYLRSLQETAGKLGLQDRISFHDGIPNDETPQVYSRHDIFVNLSRSGMLDKTIFEAVACGCRILVSNKDLAKKIGDAYVCADTDKDDTSTEIASKLEGLLTAGEEARTRSVIELQRSLIDDNRLSLLAERLYTAFRG